MKICARYVSGHLFFVTPFTLRVLFGSFAPVFWSPVKTPGVYPQIPSTHLLKTRLL